MALGLHSCRLLVSNSKLCLIIVITSLSLIVSQLWMYCYICPNLYFHIDYTFHETKEDILSDITYAARFPVGPALGHDQDDNQLKQHKHYLKKAATLTKILLNRPTLAEIERAYIPQVNCPTMARFGQINDGGYFLCNPWYLAKSQDPCVVYSLGVCGLVDFEKAVYAASGHRCNMFSFDMNDEPDSIFRPFRGTFMKATISHKTDPKTNRYSLLDITKKFGHNNLDILKMDVEGAEFSALPTFLRHFNGTVCQLLIEVHENDTEDGSRWVRLFQMLERRGFRMFYREVHAFNHSSFMCSYIHLTCLERLGLSSQEVLFTYFV